MCLEFCGLPRPSRRVPLPVEEDASPMIASITIARLQVGGSWRRLPLAALRLAALACLLALLPGFGARRILAPASPLAGVAIPYQAPAAVAAALPQRTPGYPLLANYNGFALATDVPAFAYYGLVIGSQPAGYGRPSAVQMLRRADPRAAILVYQRTLQVDYPLIRQMYGTDAIFPGWWLLRSGSVLVAPVSARQTGIAVADPTRFRRFDDVLVDGESMHVLAIRGSTLIVQRGFFSRASAHAAGVRIAAHYSYRVDLRNTILQGKWENRRPWSFNLSSLCPRDPRGRTWADFLADHMARIVARDHWDGVFFDNTDEVPRDPWLDANNDNLPDGGVIGAVNVWHQGQLALLRRFHQLAPHALIMDNGTLDAASASNGREFEGFPAAAGQYMATMNDYAYWQRHDARPALDLINPDSVRSPRFDFGAMRFGLASALLGDGYFAYDEGWHKHGVVWNFDEFDQGLGSALLRDVSPYDVYLPVRHTYRFHRGDLILVGREQMLVRDLGNWNLIVQRGVNGTRATSHPAGSQVATPAQLAAGSGYLGGPLATAAPLSAPLRTPNLITNGGFARSSYRWQLQADGPHSGQIQAGGLSTGFVTGPRAGKTAALPADRSVGQSGMRDPYAYGISVPWQPLRLPSAVRLSQRDMEVRPGTPYTLTFWARGTPGLSLPIVLGGLRPDFHMRYASYAVTLHQGWYRYVLRYTSPPEVRRLGITFLFGATYGRTMLTGIQLQEGQSLVFARPFAHGLVLVNQGDAAAFVRLDRTYWHLQGDQDPAVNNGLPARRLWLPAHAGLILLNAPPPAQG